MSSNIMSATNYAPTTNYPLHPSNHPPHNPPKYPATNSTSTNNQTKPPTTHQHNHPLTQHLSTHPPSTPTNQTCHLPPHHPTHQPINSTIHKPANPPAESRTRGSTTLLLTPCGPNIVPVQCFIIISSGSSSPMLTSPCPAPFSPFSNSYNKRKLRGTALVGKG